MSKILIVIPSRLGATRLPEKPLLDIEGKPMIQWVYEVAQASQVGADIVVATDHERIFKAVLSFGGEAIMTSESCKNGTERVFEAYKKLNKTYDVIVNLQGDEPMMDPVILKTAIKKVTEDQFDIGTAMTDIENIDELKSQSCVKVLVDHKMKALYFSRYPIPFSNISPDHFSPQHHSNIVFRHLGLYVYQKEILEKLVSSPVIFLEQAESLEQLRALYLGYSIGMAFTPGFRGISVDTPLDIEKVRQRLKRN